MTDAPQTDNKTDSEQEINLWDMVDFLQENWRTLCASMLTGLILALAYFWWTPNLYKADGLLQGGRVSSVDKGNQMISGEIEDYNVLFERLKSPALYIQQSTLIAPCLPLNKGGLKAEENLAKTLKASLVKNTRLINLSFQATSPEKAQQCLEAILQAVQATQKETGAQLLKQKQDQLAMLKQRLSDIEKAGTPISRQQLNQATPDEKFSAMSLWASIYLNKQTEIKELRTQISELDNALLPPQTSPALFVTPIYVSPEPVSPKLWLLLLVGILGSGVLGLAYLFGKKVWRTRPRRAS